MKHLSRFHFILGFKPSAARGLEDKSEGISLLKRFLSEDPNVLFFLQLEKRSYSIYSNIGVANCKGDHFVCLGSCDVVLANLPKGRLQVLRLLFPGTGIAFTWVPANSLVSHYFSRWRPIAYAVASSGECVFAVMFSPFFRWLIETYGWQGALLVIGGLQLNLCVCGALMRPLEEDGEDVRTTQEAKEAPPLPPRRRTKVVFQFSLMGKPELLLYILFGILAAAGFFIPPLFLAPFVSSLGTDSYWPAFLLSALALADLAGRLLCGWVANARLVRNLQLLAVVVALLGAVLLLLPVSHDYWTILVFSALYGFLLGCAVAIHVTSIVDIVTLEGFDSGLGLFMLFRSVGGFIGPPAAGEQTRQRACFTH